MTHPAIAPIRKQILVAAPQERVFRVFTQKLEAWWPREHHIGKSPMRTAIIEPQPGGRWYEVGEDDTQCDWGKVLAWEPPARLVLTWQITAAWTYDPAFVTELEVVFHPEGTGKTRVELEHRYLERYGEAAGQMRAVLDQGWEGTLAQYERAVLELT